MRYLSWLITIPLAAFAVSFAVSNMGLVDFGLWPLPFTVAIPVYLAVLITFVAGFVCGGLVAWMGGHRQRRTARQERARAEKLQRQVNALTVEQADLREQVKAATQPAQELLPAAAPLAAVPARV